MSQRAQRQCAFSGVVIAEDLKAEITLCSWILRQLCHTLCVTCTPLPSQACMLKVWPPAGGTIEVTG